MMNRGAANSEYFIPMDLIPEIIFRLPAKSIARFRCVSKPWKSIICSHYLKSISNPRLLIGVVNDGEWSFFSCPRPHNHNGNSSLVVAAGFHTKFYGGYGSYYFSYASGLFYFPKMLNSKEYQNVISNPITGQFAILPSDMRIPRYKYRYGFLGFDPIGKQFKFLVLKVRVRGDELVYRILTLGTEKLSWREIKCPSIYGPFANSHGICINGVLYYKSENWTNKQICCFDVRSEKFKFLKYPDGIEWFHDLINYKGKLCASMLEYGDDGGFPLKLSMCVLEDVEKEEWSPYAYTLSDENKADKFVYYDLSVVGVTSSGEIVLAKKKAHKPFYVFYFNPEANNLLSVEIQGVREKGEWPRDHRVYYFVDHVEDLNFDVMK